MASERCSEPADPMIFNKLPHPEPATAFLPSKIPATSSPAPQPENHFSYKGSYFACPLQSPEGPEQPLAGWSPAPAYLHHSPSALGQPGPAEEPLLAFLVHPAESPGKPLLVKKAAPLAVPTPVYRAPASFLAPRMSLLLGTQAQSLQQRPGVANWTLPPATHPLHPSEPHTTGPCSDHGLTLLPPTSCPTAQSQKKVPELPGLSLDPWPKLQAPDASPVSRERPAMCYPPPPYPLSPHRAGPLYHPPAPTVGEPSALPTFGYVGSREPFASTYLKPQAPRSYFPSPLEPYVQSPAGARLGVVLRDAVPPRDAELPRSVGYPGFALSPGDAAVFHGSFPSTEPGSEQHGADSPRWRAAPRHSSAFQPVCTAEKLSGTGEGNACEVKDPAQELVRPSPSVTPTRRLEELRDTKALSSSPPMPVIHNVFSLAPYQEYLQRAKESNTLLFCRKHLDPKNPDGVDTEELPPEEMALDLSFKTGLVEAGDTQRPTECVQATMKGEDKEEKEAAGGREGLGEGAQPPMPEADSGGRSNFQSSISFMFQKYKLLPSLLPSTEPPQQDGSPKLSIIIGPNLPQTLLLKAPPTPVAERVSVVKQVGGVPTQTPSQCFTTLHTSLCDTISGSVSRSSPELLRQWLEKADNGREIWLAFQDVAGLLTKLLCQLENFKSSCPFPYVVRAGAIFIPIHVVKEKLFPKLPGSFVDQVLQKHKVELRPTTLSEEKHLRDLELKSCTSRMLKLLALKQLREIYPDLLNLHWHSSIQQQLGR
uniref:Uncharacterized protein n=1 Tax=Ficedula albicollis TaxID=59894 RepID=A0A803V5K9_FICAL